MSSSNCCFLTCIQISQEADKVAWNSHLLKSCDPVGKSSACNAGDLGSIPGSGRSSGEGNGNQLQHSCLENPLDRGAWQATVHGITRVRHDLATKPPHNQRLWCSQWSRSRCFSGILLLFFDDPLDVGNLISGSSAFSESSLNIWRFSVHILLKSCLENSEHYFASMLDECNCAVVWTFFGFAFLWDWNGNWPFPVLWPLLSFPDLLAYWV